VTLTKHADLRFYAALRDFLSTDRRSGAVTRTFDVPGSVKDMIEACGIPHTEVDVVVANGTAVDFTYRVQDGDRISVYPPFTEFEIEPARRVGPDPLPELRFVVDGHLGKLARHLRLLGFDTFYDIVWSDPDLVTISTEKDRILLTRDIGLLMHGALTRGYFVRAIGPRQQLIEVAGRFDLASSMLPFSRCTACNGELRPVAKEAIVHRLPPGTREHHDDFQQCPECGRAYWRGAHFDRLQEIVDLVAAIP
jgi:uncharacterized protein with PIN domain